MLAKHSKFWQMSMSLPDEMRFEQQSSSRMRTFLIIRPTLMRRRLVLIVPTAGTQLA
jgi:hypothetical protein